MIFGLQVDGCLSRGGEGRGWRGLL